MLEHEAAKRRECAKGHTRSRPLNREEAFMHGGHPERHVYFGQAPGPGRYHCTNCGETVELEGEERLPRCPVCNNTAWEE